MENVTTLKTPEQMLYVRSMGKLLRITAIAMGMESANKYMETHRDEGLVAEFGSLCLIANLYDPGTKVDRSLRSLDLDAERTAQLNWPA